MTEKPWEAGCSYEGKHGEHYLYVGVSTHGHVFEDSDGCLVRSRAGHNITFKKVKQKQRYELWVNFYKDGSFNVHDSKDDAASVLYLKSIACLKFEGEYEEGQFDD